MIIDTERIDIQHFVSIVDPGWGADEQSTWRGSTVNMLIVDPHPPGSMINTKMFTINCRSSPCQSLIPLQSNMVPRYLRAKHRVAASFGNICTCAPKICR